MLKTSLGIGSKLTALIISTLLLTGCYKIKITETLNLDGTSIITTEIDMSGLEDTMNDMTDSLNINLEGADVLTEVLTEKVTETYASCSDPLLLAKYGADNLEGPVAISNTLQVKKSTSCALSETDNFIDITTEEINTETGDIISTQTLKRKADSCDAPAILAFYQISNFEEPINEEYTLEKTVEISCSDTRKEIMISTVTSFAGNDESIALTERFGKPVPVIIPDETQAELNALVVSTEDEQEAGTKAEAREFCSNIKQDPNEMAFFYTGCEDTAADIGLLSFNKFDTTGLSINSSGTVTYRLSSTTQKFNNKLTSDDSGQPVDNLSAAMMGVEMTYTLVSPWPILDYSTGELTDEYTLVFDMLKLSESQEITVTLDTDGSTLDLVSPSIQQQIDNLITTLKERLAAATAPVERQVEYIHLLSNKIQRLAAIKPRQKAALGYLQAELINLAGDLQLDPLAEIEADFLSEIKNLDAEIFAEEDAEDNIETETTEEEPESIEVEVETKTETGIEVEAEQGYTQDEDDEEENLNDEDDDSPKDEESSEDNAILTE